MVFGILESTFMTNIIKKNVFLDKNVKLISTKGHLFSYLFSKGKLELFEKENKKEIFSFFKEIDLPFNKIVIMTDQDPAGELIAYEIATCFNNAIVYRFQKPVEELLIDKYITEDYLMKYSISKINLLKGIRYLEERFLSDYQEEKLKTISALAQKNIVKIPKGRKK